MDKYKKSMRGIHFTTLPASPCAAEFYEIWHTRSTHRRNHVCQIFSRSVQGLRSSDTPKIAISHWLAASPLQQCAHCRATLWSTHRVGPLRCTTTSVACRLDCNNKTLHWIVLQCVSHQYSYNYNDTESGYDCHPDQRTKLEVIPIHHVQKSTDVVQVNHGWTDD